jgi:hypothetical protein
MTQRLACWPPAGDNNPTQYATSPVLAGTTIIELSLGPFRKVGLVRCKIKYVSGACANFTPYIFSKSGVTTAGDIAQEFAGSATAVAALFDPQLGDRPVVMQADAAGKLYLMIGPDAGANNIFNYALRFLVYE